LESLKCLASVLEVNVDTLQKTRLDMKTQEELWQAAPLWVRCWFALNYLNLTPSKCATVGALFTYHTGKWLFILFTRLNKSASTGGRDHYVESRVFLQFLFMARQ